MVPGLTGKSEMIVKEEDLVSQLGERHCQCPLHTKADSTFGGSCHRCNSGLYSHGSSESWDRGEDQTSCPQHLLA